MSIHEVVLAQMYEMIELGYAFLGCMPVIWCVTRLLTSNALAWTVLMSAALSCIDLGAGGFFGWCMRYIAIIPLVYLVRHMYDAENNTLAPTSMYKPSLATTNKPSTQSYTKPARFMNFASLVGSSKSSTLPSISLLNATHTAKITEEDRSSELLQIMQDFGIRGSIQGVKTGPAVTMYKFRPTAGLKNTQVTVLASDIARAMSALSVRIASVAGENFLGIEVSNSKRATVQIREVIEETQNDNAVLPLALGRDIAGKALVADLAKMPHLLVAGTTGSGKSVAIHAMLLSLLYRLDHKKMRLMLIDPKMLEFSAYKDIPHLLHPVVTNPQDAVNALKWVVREMERRYQKLSEAKVRDIAGYNARNEHMEYIVVIVDEMADLMLVAGKEIEIAVQRLAQMARASGIHLIMATQRPSVDVITGTIKANFPSRISFQVSSKIDSRTILGEQGAEQLLGRGDMLYLRCGGDIIRAHGPMVTEDEIHQVADFLRTLSKPEYVENLLASESDQQQGAGSVSMSEDPKYQEALQLIRQAGKVSVSFLVTNMGIGYNKASRIVQQMEREGVVSPPQGNTHSRQILKP